LRAGFVRHYHENMPKEKLSMEEILNKLVVEVCRNSVLIDAVDDKVRHDGVLIEDIDDKIINLAEGQEASHEKLDHLRGAVSNLDVKVDQIDNRLIFVEISQRRLNG
jgi:hypothetical protein